MRKPPVFVIFGPTSSGKTSLALKLSKALNGVIISADSRQVYKEMDIGTGKVPIKTNYKITKLDGKWEIDGVDIYGYDIVFPNEYFSAYDFYKYASDVIEVENLKNKTIFLVGGTGFYLDVVTGRSPMSGVEPDQELRKQLNLKSTEELYVILKRSNKKLAEKVDKDNRNRIIRAIEIASSFSNIKSYKQKEVKSKLVDNFEFIHIGLTASRNDLYNRVDLWLDEIWKGGLIEETKFLMNKYGEIDKLSGLVYRSAVEFLAQKEIEENAKQKAKYDLHKYIRRQETWFKKYDDAKIFDTTDKNYYREVLNLIQSKYNHE